MKQLSVIIPAINEEEHLAAAIQSSIGPLTFEVIVADGGSQDKTKAVARKLGAKVVQAERGRSRQMNTAAARARGDVLLFLHADSILPKGYATEIEQTLQKYRHRHQQEAEWGCFESIDIEGPPLTAWLLKASVSLRTRLLCRPYGDQGLFVRRGTFQRMGGYKEWPLLEDLDLVQRLSSTCGPPAIVPCPIRTSGRRWAKLGFARTTLVNQAVLLGHRLGVDVGILAKWYEQGMR